MLHRHLEDIGADDLVLYGGKAYRLAEAQRLGCPVPETVVLSTRLYSRFLEQGALDGEILSILSTMQPAAMHQFRAAEWAINSAFSVRRLPSSVREAILDLAFMLDDGPVAVRSSTTAEGGTTHSFVGQHASYTDITTPEQLVTAVVDCWRSMFSAPAQQYAHRFGINLLSSSMAVMVQHQVDRLDEGAMFTADPVSGDPDVFVMQRKSNAKPRVHRLDPYDLDSCETALERELLRYGLLLDEHLEQYQVLEWAVDSSQTWVLRVLPITGVPAYIPAEPEPRPSVTVWRLVNPLVCDSRKLPPYSWYHRSRARDMRHALEPALSKEEARAGKDEFVRGYRYAPDVPPRGHARRERLERSSLAIVRQLVSSASTERDYASLRRSQDSRLAEIWNRDWTDTPNRELGEQLHKAVYFYHIYMSGSARLAADAIAARHLLQHVHAEWVGSDLDVEGLLAFRSRAVVEVEGQAAALAAQIDDDDTLSNSLVEKLWDKRYLLIDETLVGRLWDIALLYPDWEHLCRRARECALSGECSATALNEADRKRLELEKKAEARLHGVRRFLYQRLLCRAQGLARLDAERLEPIACALAAEHDILYKVGVRLEEKGLVENLNEVALLEYREIQDWLRGRLGDEDIHARVLERRVLYRRWWRYRPPETLSAMPDAVSPVLESSSGGLHGMAVSPGRARGRVRVLRGPGQSASLLAGEILVVQEPLTEYSSLFAMASGVICERGTLLDHAATLAREYGVPAVFSLPEATRILETGQLIELDAFRGVVQCEPRVVSWD